MAQPMAQPDHNKPMAQLTALPDHNQTLPGHNTSQVTTSRPKRDTKAPVKLDM